MSLFNQAFICIWEFIFKVYLFLNGVTNNAEDSIYQWTSFGSFNIRKRSTMFAESLREFCNLTDQERNDLAIRQMTNDLANKNNIFLTNVLDYGFI